MDKDIGQRHSVPDFCRLVIIALGLVLAAADPAVGYSTEKAGFSIEVKKEICPYRVMAVFVLPEETLTLRVVDPTKANEYSIVAATGDARSIGERRWQWQAPGDAGLYPVKIRRADGSDAIDLNVFVMVRSDSVRGEYLNGYRIGGYPDFALKGLKIYEPPKGFVEVTEENQNTLISPHFRVGQFLSKQAGGFPKYLILREGLLLKLELILEKVNESGHLCETLHIMSGYRTPYYNKAIGNVKYSRHVYGGAADVFIDENPRDEMMDDLNGDGKSDYRDAAIVYEIIDTMYGNKWYEPYVGGLARYKKTAAHGPFVHVDVRGFRARWGD